MATTDLDPLFVRALKLLNSKSRESAAQLKAMVDEAIAQRKGLKVFLCFSVLALNNTVLIACFKNLNLRKYEWLKI